MRQIAFRDFRLQGAKALGKLRPGEGVILSGRQGPAYFLIPIEAGTMAAQEEELNTAMALASMRESWRRADAAGLADLAMDEIDAEAERHANAIRHARELTPAKIVRKSGFGRPQYHPNASRNNFAMVD